MTEEERHFILSFFEQLEIAKNCNTITINIYFDFLFTAFHPRKNYFSYFLFIIILSILY